LQGGFLLARGGVGRIPPRAMLELGGSHYYLVNPGSVGQPRDGDPRAGYALFWPAERHIEFHRVGYNVAKAAAKIRSAGLPDSLAQRLHEGC
jgi:diadenosine tetraphosphatase ApaH/serine/threonine PP2A family protein phosphatase